MTSKISPTNYPIFKKNTQRIFYKFSLALQVYFSSYLDQYNTVLQLLEQRKSEHDNWNLFQMCLTLLQTAGEVLTEMKRLDQELIQNMIDCGRKQALTEFIPVLLVPSGQQELKDLIVSVQDGKSLMVIWYIKLI